MDIIIETYTREAYKNDFLKVVKMLKKADLKPGTLMFQITHWYCGRKINEGFTTNINEIIEAIDEKAWNDINGVSCPVYVKKIVVHFELND